MIGAPGVYPGPLYAHSSTTGDKHPGPLTITDARATRSLHIETPTTGADTCTLWARREGATVPIDLHAAGWRALAHHAQRVADALDPTTPETGAPTP